MRDKKVREAFHTHLRYHRLNVQFDNNKLRLDDIQSISKVRLKVQEDESSCKTINNITRCITASLFYFKLDSIP